MTTRNLDVGVKIRLRIQVAGHVGVMTALADRMTSGMPV